MIGNKTLHINKRTIDLTKSIAKQINIATPDYIDKAKLIRFLEEWQSNSEVIIQQTSGSTGTPKPIELKKTAMLASAKLTCDHFHLTSNSTFLLCLDINYIAGKMMVIRALYSGANLILRSPDRLASSYPSTTIDFVAMVPLQLESLIYNKININSTKQILLGGAPITETQQKQFEKLSSAIWQSYATTETYSHVALRRLNGIDASDNYSALPGISFSLTENQTLKIKAPILIDSPITTNDVVELKDPYTFEWIGRSDFIINSGGIKVSPELIEKLISKHISIPYYISSKKTEPFGEEICLILETNTQLLESEEKELLSTLKHFLPKYHAPRTIIYVDSLPKTENGKLKREKY